MAGNVTAIRRLEDFGKGGAQHLVDLGHRRIDPEGLERGHPVLDDPARDDAAVMVELRVDVEPYTVIGHPAPHPHADRGDLVLRCTAPHHPNADPALAPLALDAEMRKAADHPFLEPMDMASYIGSAPGEIEHDIGDALPGSVIGVAAAAAG